VADSIAERLVLSEVDIEMLLEVLEVVCRNLCDVFLDIRERISYILVAPQARVEEHIKDGLLLNQHLIRFILDSLRDLGRLRKVYSVRWWLPIVLYRCVVWRAHVDTASI